MEYELAIIGGGPAACAAAVYAARKRIKTIQIAQEIGGQSVVSDTIYNWIGTPAIKGAELAEDLKQHVENYTTPENTLTLMLGKRAGVLEKDTGTGLFIIPVEGTEDQIKARSVLIATGSRRKQLDIPGADTFNNKGVMYCATCDGPLFSEMPVAVIGGGNAAIEAVLQLSQYAKHVTLLHRSDTFRADEISVEQAKKLPNATLLTNIELLEIKGETFVSSLVYKSKDTGETTELPVNGIFVEIGQLPNTDIVRNVVPIDQHGKIIVDPMNQRAKLPGVWAAGDCTNGLYHQNNIAAGDAVKAIEDLYIWLKTGK